MLRNIKGHKKNKVPKIVVISTEYECIYCQHRHTRHRYGIIWLGRLLFRIPMLRVKKYWIEESGGSDNA